MQSDKRNPSILHTVCELKCNLSIYVQHKYREPKLLHNKIYTITQESVDLDFEGYGIKLRVPGGIVPAEISETQLDVRFSLSGQFQMPSGSQFVSAIYWVSSPYKLTQLKYSIVLDLLTINSVHSLHLSIPCITRRNFLTCSWSKVEESSLPTVHVVAYHYPTSLVLA